MNSSTGQQPTDMQKTERRSGERYPFLKTIRYACISDRGGEEFKGVTIDISKDGLCMYIFPGGCVREGVCMEIKDDLPVSSQTAIVRWSRQMDQDLYRVGLQFY
jgi:c-di-GMP-binding flagellar brake protein YcgR